LVAKLIGYELPEGNLHQYFGRQYFNTPALDAEQYNQSKSITFRMLYGNLYPEYRNIKFFKMVHEYIKTLWSQFESQGYIETPMSKRKIYKTNFTDMTPSKLFNYILQGYETDVNSIMLHKILEYLYKKYSKLILYTYDSFLFVYDKRDGKEFIKDVQSILNNYSMHSSLKIGLDYNNMKTPQKVII
jgi:DNA polymerase I-like protein with 3'-5' exonuclease and polymerase domains